jgi:hypothetical protein
MEEVTQPVTSEEQPQTEQQLSAETWETERSELTQQIESLKAELHGQRINSAFYRKAKAAGISDPDALAGIVDLSKVTFDEAGHAQGIDEIIAGLTAATKQSKPKPIGDSSYYSGDRPEKTTAQMLREAGEKARSGRIEDMAAYSELKRKTKN